MSTPTVIVIAKEPRAGAVKTRLTPPLTAEQGATLAAAAIHDTVRAASASAAGRVVVALDGTPGRWLGDVPVDVVAQRGRGLDERIAAAFGAVGAPALLIGMDTPHVDAGFLSEALATLESHDAVLGPAEDGGFWAIGIRAPHPELFLGIPMSTGRTGAAQLARLRSFDLDVAVLPQVRDVDTYADAVAVAALAPRTRFAIALASLMPMPAGVR
jgi:rSAM/selenodomain-associated transferase 1